MKLVFEFRNELKLFFEEYKKTKYFDWLNEKNWMERLANLIDILIGL